MVAINKLDLWPPCTPRGGRRQQENLEKTGNGGNDYAMPREQDEADALPTRSRNVDVYPTLRHRAKHSTRLRWRHAFRMSAPAVDPRLLARWRRHRKPKSKCSGSRVLGYHVLVRQNSVANIVNDNTVSFLAVLHAFRSRLFTDVQTVCSLECRRRRPQQRANQLTLKLDSARSFTARRRRRVGVWLSAVLARLRGAPAYWLGVRRGRRRCSSVAARSNQQNFG